MLSWILQKLLTYLFASNYIASDIDKGKTVEHTKFKENEIRE